MEKHHGMSHGSITHNMQIIGGISVAVALGCAGMYFLQASLSKMAVRSLMFEHARHGEVHHHQDAGGSTEAQNHLESVSEDGDDTEDAIPVSTAVN